jgi:hypothetical protein
MQCMQLTLCQTEKEASTQSKFDLARTRKSTSAARLRVAAGWLRPRSRHTVSFVDDSTDILKTLYH